MANDSSSETPVRTPDRSNRQWRTLATVLLAVVLFGVGVLAGSGLRGFAHRDRMAEHRGDRSGRDSDRDRDRRGRRDSGRDRDRDRSRGEGFRDRLVSRLELDDAQTAQLDSFLEANRSEAREFWEDTHSRYRELRLRFREQIRDILTDEQRETFDALIARMEEQEARRSSEQGSRRGRNGRGSRSVEEEMEEESSEGEPQ